MSDIHIAVRTQNILGESPIWSYSRQSLLWVDTYQGILSVFHPNTATYSTYNLPKPLSFVVENNKSELIVGIGSQIAKLDTQYHWHLIATAPLLDAEYRFNDAKMDAQGRLWCGFINEQLKENSGYLYCLDQTRNWIIADDGFTLINGLAWSHDNQTLFVTDSIKRIIYAYDFYLSTGNIANKRIFAEFGELDGKPDGLIIDNQGYLLSVMFDGSAIIRLSPDGKTLKRYPLAVKRPTSCCLVNNDTDLYITTACLGLTAPEQVTSPQSGCLLKVSYQQFLS